MMCMKLFRKKKPKNANIVCIHFMYKINIKEEGTMDMKCRAFTNGNKDKNKDSVRKDRDAI